MGNSNKKKKKDILSQKEIAKLLSIVEKEIEEESNHINYSPQIILYDFKRPCVLSREQLRCMKKIHDNFSISFSKKLKSLFSTDVDIQLHSVDQMTYGEFLMSIPSNSWKEMAATTKDSGLVIIEINNSISEAIIFRLLSLEGIQKNFLSDEERSLLNFLVQQYLLPILEDSFDSFPTEFYLLNSKEIIQPEDIVCLVVMELIIGNNSGMINLAYPIKFNEKMFKEISNVSK